MGAAASSSSSYSSVFSPKKYDVFISFRGEDTRTNFTSHLHTALCNKNIETYIDYKLHKGDEISQALLQAIQDSNISLVVFSENYASSKWCLDELTQMIQCKNNEGQVVIPIFYEVDPSDVRKQKGTYKKAFAKHMRDLKNNQDKVHKWKEALRETANLAGWDTRKCRDESKLIEDIVNDVLRKLHHKYPSELKGLVGIDKNCKSIELLLKKVPTIGIWGMGGIGKTTMTKAVFAKLSSQFENCCFLENFREESEKHGLSFVHDKIISKLLEDENLHGSMPISFGSTFVIRRLSKKKVFIVLDDVSNSKQLDDLAKECDHFGPGSKVIITTRDKHVLIGRVHEIYEAKALSDPESLKLFCLNAFHKDCPKVGYKQLSKRAVNYAKGIPLALTVLGSFLHDRTTEEWDSALTNLKKASNQDIQNLLKLSYDGLNYEEREIFLDIACFLKGQHKESVMRLYDTPNFSSSIILRTLSDKALITIDNYVWMHDLIQGMGKEIVRRQCIEEPGRRSHLWDSEDVSNVLRYNKGTDAIRGLILDEDQVRLDLNLNADTFAKMPCLKFLKFYSSSLERSSNVNLPFGLGSFGGRLKYFFWENYPLETLSASTFCVENLVEIHLKNSKVRKLWEGVQDLVNLKVINLGGSSELIELPDLSKAQNLEYIYLSYCRSLPYAHILSLPKLVTLDLYSCSELKSLKSENLLGSLTILNLNYCSSLKVFSLKVEKLTDLYLTNSRVEMLDSSIGCMSNLKRLYINGSRLESLPINELCHLTFLEVLGLTECAVAIERPKLHKLFNALSCLKELYLNGCSNLSKLPHNISALSSLHTLSLSRSGVESLPVSIKHLSKLKSIHLQECKRLRSLPELPPFVSHLYATNCTSLKTAFTFSFNYRMESCLLHNCVNLDEHSICRITENSYFSSMRAFYIDKIKEFTRQKVCYPGSSVPEWFGNNRTRKASIAVELAPSSQSVGFIFGIVISQIPHYMPHAQYLIRGLQSMDLYYRFCFEEGEKIQEISGWQSCRYIKLGPSDSDNVLLWYEPVDGINLRDTACNPKISFEFSSNNNWLIKEYGVCPIYATRKSIDYSLKLQDRELQGRDKIDQIIEESILSTLGIGDCL